MLGLGSSLTKSGIVTPGIVTDNLVLKHNYNAASVVPISDGAAYFDGSSEYIDCGDDASLRTASFTVSAWVWFPVLDVYTGIVSSIDNADTNNRSGFSMTKKSNNEVEWRTGYTTDLQGSTSNTKLEANRWYHVALTYDGSTQKGYIDGVLEDSDSYANYTVSTENFIIGAYYASAPTSLEMNGYISNVGYWSEVLTQAQIKSIMNKNYAGLSDSEKTNLVSWWNLSADANDSHGSNNGTLT